MTDEARLWILIATVALTNGITLMVVWLYWADKYHDLLRWTAAEERSREGQTQNIRIRKDT